MEFESVEPAPREAEPNQPRTGLPAIPGYDVQAEVGRGGMGVVYRARQTSTGRTLALKMMLCGRTATFRELARFRIEAEALACLDHPNIVKIRDVGVFAGCPYFALDFAERGSLRQVAGGARSPLAGQRRWCEPWRWPSTMRMAAGCSIEI